ncbi:MAG TPA: IS256 family transposase, partial [Actinobacteria bacterium]|nr:IS256 family transposase [Actinomycetota bacterium]
MDMDGKKIVVKNGSMLKRDIVTGIGPLAITQPRIDDRRLDSGERFSSSILPKYMRRIPSIDSLIPVLYLKGISTNDFGPALTDILGEEVSGLSSTNIVRLKKVWENDYQLWRKRDLSGKDYVYFWVDGIYFNVRLDDNRSCILVIMAADKYGNKELVAVSDGYRESKIGWKELLLDLKKRGLAVGPRLSIGDGGLGFWAALDEIYPETKRHPLWV